MPAERNKNVVARFLTGNAPPTEAPGAVVGAFVVFTKTALGLPSSCFSSSIFFIYRELATHDILSYH